MLQQLEVAALEFFLLTTRALGLTQSEHINVLTVRADDIIYPAMWSERPAPSGRNQHSDYSIALLQGFDLM